MRFRPTARSRMPWGWPLMVVLTLTPLLPAMAAGYLPNYEGLEPREREMFKAVNDSDPVQVAAVLEQGANVNACDGRGESVLLHAAIRNDITTMKVLLQAGASVDQATSWGRTALIAAAEASAIDAVGLLLGSQADVNTTLDDGTTALMEAARFSDVRLVRVLLEKGADPNARTTDGLYPLLIAAGRGNAEMVRLLKAKGAVADEELRSGIERIQKTWSAKTIGVVDAIFREAVQNWSTAPSLVLVTVVAARTEQRRGAPKHVVLGILTGYPATEIDLLIPSGPRFES